MNEGLPTWLYRIYSHDRKVLLYVGISMSWPRRMAQHMADKPWFPADCVVEVEEYPDRLSALDAEAAAIRREHPLHNVQHNTVRIDVTASAEVELSPANLLAMAAIASGSLLLLQWGASYLANWWVQRQGAKQGIPVQVPPVINPFTATPSSALATFFYCTAAAAIAAQRAGSSPEALRLAALRVAPVATEPRSEEHS